MAKTRPADRTDVTEATGITDAARSNRWLLDAAVTMALIGFAIAVLAFDTDDGVAAGRRSYAIAVVASTATMARRSYPIPTLALVVVGRLLITADSGHEALTPAVVVMAYTVARHGNRRLGLAVASITIIAMGLASAVLSDEPFLLELIGELAIGFLPIAVADGARTRAERFRDRIESEVEARVQAERLRIARDLHDVVAHGLATIALQSGVAAHLLDQDPAQARAALDSINEVGKTSLDELRTMVGVLRSTDGAEVRPIPTEPNDLGALLARAGELGIAVSGRTSGTFPADVSDATVVAVHRIVQEALTNVARHAPGATATVELDHHDAHVAIEIANDRPAGVGPTVASTGVGIVGMRERAESLSGNLDAGPTADGGYRVAAVVPYHRRGS